MITRHAILPLMFSVHGIANSTARFVIEIGLEIHFPSSVQSQIHRCTQRDAKESCISF